MYKNSKFVIIDADMETALMYLLSTYDVIVVMINPYLLKHKIIYNKI